MLERKDLFELVKVVANADSKNPVAYSYKDNKFSYTELNDTLREEMNQLAGTYALYRENKNVIFSLIETAIDTVLPRKVIQQYGEFAEIKTFAQGDKPVFVQKISQQAKRRGKQFITKVGLAGVYEVFKLDNKSFEIPTEAFGGAAQIGLEEFLDGRVNFADLLDIILEGLDENVYKEIEKALISTVSSLQSANKTTQTSFVETAMDQLLTVADSYGKATIYCTYEFAATMLPNSNWASDKMKDQRWSNGYLANYKGHNVIVLDQSFEDDTNLVKVMDPKYAWIIPVGADKPVKIAFEGNTITQEFANHDGSREIQVYKKFGVGTIVTNNICVYINSSLHK